MESRTMRWAGYEARMGAGECTAVGFWWELEKERDYLENLDMVEKTILKWIL
jgi:hypothetical protein